MKAQNEEQAQEQTQASDSQSATQSANPKKPAVVLKEADLHKAAADVMGGEYGKPLPKVISYQPGKIDVFVFGEETYDEIVANSLASLNELDLKFTFNQRKRRGFIRRQRIVVGYFGDLPIADHDHYLKTLKKHFGKDTEVISQVLFQAESANEACLSMRFKDKSGEHIETALIALIPNAKVPKDSQTAQLFFTYCINREIFNVLGLQGITKVKIPSVKAVDATRSTYTAFDKSLLNAVFGAEGK